MTSARARDDAVDITLSKAEALILFEWLSRNWEANKWEVGGLFADPAERQLLIWLENDLEGVLDEVFDPNYKELVNASCGDVRSRFVEPME